MVEEVGAGSVGGEEIRDWGFEIGETRFGIWDWGFGLRIRDSIFTPSGYCSGEGVKNMRMIYFYAHNRAHNFILCASTLRRTSGERGSRESWEPGQSVGRPTCPRQVIRSANYRPDFGRRPSTPERSR